MTKQQKIEDLKRQAAQIAEEISQLEAEPEAEPESGPKAGEPVVILLANGLTLKRAFEPDNTLHTGPLAVGNVFWGPNAERDAEYVADRRKNHEAKCPPPFEDKQWLYGVSSTLDRVDEFRWRSYDLHHQAMHAANLIFATKEEAEARRMELKEGK